MMGSISRTGLPTVNFGPLEGRSLADPSGAPILPVMKTVPIDDVTVSPQVMAWLRGDEEIVF